MKRRSFNQEHHYEDFNLDVNNLLHSTIYNFGTKDIKVFDLLVAPNKFYTFPSDGVPFSNDLVIPIKVTGINTAENHFYITYTTLYDSSC